jgi:hypothetical protein
MGESHALMQGMIAATVVLLAGPLVIAAGAAFWYLRYRRRPARSAGGE